MPAMPYQVSVPVGPTFTQVTAPSVIVEDAPMLVQVTVPSDTVQLIVWHQVGWLDPVLPAAVALKMYLPAFRVSEGWILVLRGTACFAPGNSERESAVWLVPRYGSLGLVKAGSVVP